MKYKNRELKQRYRTPLLLLAVLILVVGCPITSAAQGLGGDRVQINGYGTWAYGKTNNDNYTLFAGPDGEYEHLEAALSFSGTVSDDVKVYMQPNFEYGHEGFDVELGFAFVDWEIKENLHLRAGRVRQPFGIYTEVFDVGTLRPFINLPQGVYHDGKVARAYNGLGLNGTLYTGDWSLEYDLYGGQIDLETVIPGGIGLYKDNVKDTIGGRLVVHTPIDGLRFGFSGYSGEQGDNQRNVEVGGSTGTQTTLGILGEYLANGWSVRSEWLDMEDPTFHSNMAYFELAYMVNENWQVAGRWDWFDNDFDFAAVGYPAAFNQFTQHEDIAVAVNYWVNPKMVFKLEYHKIDGNRFSGPENVEAAIFQGTFEDETDAIQLGVSFAF